MKYLLFCVTLNVALSSVALFQPWQDYPDEKPPKMSIKEENEYMKSQMRGFIIGGIVAFIVYRVTKDGVSTALSGGAAFFATLFWGTGAGVVVAILIVFFNLKGQKT